MTTRAGPVIRGGDVDIEVIPVENSASAFYLQNLHYLGNLKTLSAGTPVSLNPNICLDCLQQSRHQPILDRCSVTPSRIYPKGSLEVGVQAGDTSFGTIAVGFRNKKKKFSGPGDLAHYNITFEIFTFFDENKSENPDSNPPIVKYFAYNHQKHCNDLVKKAKAARKTKDGGDGIVWARTKAPVRTFQIRCGTCQLSGKSLTKALMVYRTMQIENSITRTKFHSRGSGDEKEGFFEMMTANDIIRAVLSVKIMDDLPGWGEFVEFSQCTTYNWIFVLPLVLSLMMVLVLNVVAKMYSNRELVARVPYNSSSWFQEVWRSREVLDRSQWGARGRGWRDILKWRIRPLEGIHDEMSLQEEGDWLWIQLHRYGTDDGDGDGGGGSPAKNNRGTTGYCSQRWLNQP